MNSGFGPWVGENYAVSNLKVLVLGESHYGGTDCDYEGLTRYVIRTFGIERRDAFTTRVTKLVALYPSNATPTDAERVQFWNSVCFYNYVQRLVGPTARIAPTDADWLSAANPFFATVDKLRPDLIVALGFRLWSRLAEVGTKVACDFACNKIPHLGGASLIIPVKHPSAWGFRYRDWQSRIEQTYQLLNVDPQFRFRRT